MRIGKGERNRNRVENRDSYRRRILGVTEERSNADWKDGSKGNKVEIRIDTDTETEIEMEIEIETGTVADINDSLGLLVACSEVVSIQGFWERFDSHPRLP